MVLLHSYSSLGLLLEQADLMAQLALAFEMHAVYAAPAVHAELTVQSHQTA